MPNKLNYRTPRSHTVDAQLAVARTLGHEAGSIQKGHKYDSQEFTDVFVDSLDALTEQDTQVTYLSTPVTGGPEKYDFLLEKGVSSRNELSEEQLSEYASEVVSENIEEAGDVAADLRSEGREFVLNPAGLGNMSDWTQGDYMHLWTETIDQHIDSMVVRDGWEYSMGCSMEVKQAFDADIPVSDQNGAPISEQRAIEMAKAAESKVADLGFDVSNFKQDEVLSDPNFSPEEYLKEL